MGFLKWIVALFRAWLVFKADQQEHVGEIKKENADLRQEIEEDQHAAAVKDGNDRLSDTQLDDWVRRENSRRP